MKFRRRFASIFCILLWAGLASAKPRSFDLKDGGRFEIDIPDDWTVEKGGSDEEVVPWLTVKAPPAQELALELTLARNTSKTMDPLEIVRLGTEAMIADLKKISVEKEFPMREIVGPNCKGLYVAVVDRTVDKPAPDNFKYVAQGGLVAGGELVMFNLLSNAADSPQRKQAMDIIRSARHVPVAIK
jgi:hypothetical protein